MLDYIKQQLINHKLVSLLLLLLTIFITLSLISYNNADPSYNVASELQVNNVLGKTGAVIADILYQFFGISTYIIPLALLVWAITLFKTQAIRFLPIKILTILGAIISLSTAISHYIPISNLPSSSGGFIGSLLYPTITYYIGIESVAWLFFLSIFLLLLGLGIPLTTYKKIYLNIKHYYLTIKYLTNKNNNISTSTKINNNFTPLIAPISENTTKQVSPITKILPIKQLVTRTVSKPIQQQTKTDKILPVTDLLCPPDNKILHRETNEQLMQNAQELLKVLKDFGVSGNILEVNQGPVVTLYEFEPAAGTKSSRVIGLAEDIARSLAALSTRIAVISGRNVLGIELPNKNRNFFCLKELIETPEYQDQNLLLPIILGKDLAGKPFIADLAKMPHLLVAGTTGSGKSVAINTMIMSILFRYSPDECKLIMIDPKMLELSIYDNIPHLLTPVVTEAPKAVTALKWAVKEMENRYRAMSNIGVRNIAGYNAKVQEAKLQGKPLSRTVHTGFDPETGKAVYENISIELDKLPFIIVIVDEMADLMLVAGKDIENSIQRLAQMARAAGIHIIMATQRPSVDVITGVIKANFPSRISFKVTSKIDSRTILGEGGAEQLLGMGDMLYMGNSAKITRVHGPFVADQEVEAVTNYLKSLGSPQYVTAVTEAIDQEDDVLETDDISDEENLYRRAVQIVKTERKATISYLQRVFSIGYNRSAKLIERMEKEGIVTVPNHAGKREILLPE